MGGGGWFGFGFRNSGWGVRGLGMSVIHFHFKLNSVCLSI